MGKRSKVMKAGENYDFFSNLASGTTGVFHSIGNAVANTTSSIRNNVVGAPIVEGRKALVKHKNGKWYSAIIGPGNNDGTFQINYKDAGTEYNVNNDRIRLLFPAYAADPSDQNNIRNMLFEKYTLTHEGVSGVHKTFINIPMFSSNEKAEIQQIIPFTNGGSGKSLKHRKSHKNNKSRKNRKSRKHRK